MNRSAIVGAGITATLIVYAGWSFGGGVTPPVLLGAISTACATVTGMVAIMAITR